MSRQYILRRGKPVPCTLLEYSKLFDIGNSKRIVRQEYVGKTWVSTVFLSLDHSWRGGPPVLWETMIENEEQELIRYTSLMEARKGHKEIRRFLEYDRNERKEIVRAIREK
jgi:hypothetical protein